MVLCPNVLKMCFSFSWFRSPGGSAGRAVDSEEKLNLVSDLAMTATGRGFESRPGL
jgi:hypothetical protein